MIVIYHKDCNDGFAAAWVARRKYPDATFHAAGYGSDPPDVRGQEVLMVDFSYPRPVLLFMAATAISVKIIDHHDSAERQLIDLPKNVTTIFDMNHSGAMLTWLHFFPDEDPPVVLEHIEDRDIWRFEMPLTHQIHAVLSSYPMDFSLWSQFMDPRYLNTLYTKGGDILRYHNKRVEEFTKRAWKRILSDGTKVVATWCPPFFASDTAEELKGPQDMTILLWPTESDRVLVSLRSSNGFEVNRFAEKYGGGGHKAAAGMKLKMGDALLKEIWL